MDWHLVILGQVLLSSFFILLTRHILSTYPKSAQQVNLITSICVAVCGVVAGILTEASLIQLNAVAQNWPLLCLEGTCFAISTLYALKTVEHSDSGTAAIFSTLNTVSAITVATIVLGEGLSWLQLCGASIILFATLVVLYDGRPKKQQRNITLAFVYAIITAVFFSAATTTEKHLLGQMSTASYFVFGWGVQGLAATIIYRLKRPSRPVTNARFVTLATVAGLTRGLAGFLFISALIIANNLSVVSTLSSLKVVTTALLGVIILKEQSHIARKMTAAFFAMLGVALILTR